MLHNQIVHGKATNGFLLEIDSPVEVDMFCGDLNIIRLASRVRHGGWYNLITDGFPITTPGPKAGIPESA
jgi:hypothetical protein